jgi:hypothetical protein
VVVAMEGMYGDGLWRRLLLMIVIRRYLGGGLRRPDGREIGVRGLWWWWWWWWWTTDHSHPHSMKALIWAPSPSRITMHRLIANSRSLLPGAFRRLGAQTEQLPALWMTRMTRRVDLQKMVRLGSKRGLA